MLKPKNYENTPAAGETEPVELGGHIMVIKLVEETKSKSGKDMIKVYLDFAEDDRQPGHFENQYDCDGRPGKKWPNQATQYILVNDDNGNCNRSFKAFVTSAESSNEGLIIQWGTAFAIALGIKGSAACSGSRWTTTKSRGGN